MRATGAAVALGAATLCASAFGQGSSGASPALARPQTPAASPAPSKPVPAPGTEPAGGSAPSLDRSNRRFLEHLAAEDQANIAIVQLGTEHAQDPRVRAFADRLARDYLGYSAQMTFLIRTKSIALENDATADRAYRRVAAASGKEFDSRYLAAVIDWHRLDAERFEQMESGATDPDIRKFATAHLDALKRRLSEAEDLRSSLP